MSSSPNINGNSVCIHNNKLVPNSDLLNSFLYSMRERTLFTLTSQISHADMEVSYILWFFFE